MILRNGGNHLDAVLKSVWLPYFSLRPYTFYILGYIYTVVKQNMVESKLVIVLDEGTNMLFLVTKFEESDTEMLASKGWEFSPELTIITSIGPEARSSMSVFDYPRYDIERRTGKLSYNHTTHGLAEVVKDMDFESIPDVIDVENMMLKQPT